MGTGWAAGGSPGGRRRLGEDKGRRRRLGEVITALGLADEVQIARLSDQLGLPFLDLGSMPSPTRRWPCSPATSPSATARSR